MSRYSTRLPFSTAADLVVRRGFRYNGEQLQPGRELPAGFFRDRLAAALYEQRKVDMLPPKEAPADDQSTAGTQAAGTTDGPLTIDLSNMTGKKLDAFAEEHSIELPEGWQGLRVAEKKEALQRWQKGEPMLPEQEAETPPEQPQEQPQQPDAQGGASEPEKRHTVKRAGFGGYKVISPDGEPIGDGHETKEAADAEAARLDGLIAE